MEPEDQRIPRLAELAAQVVDGFAPVLNDLPDEVARLIEGVEYRDEMTTFMEERVAEILKLFEGVAWTTHSLVMPQGVGSDQLIARCDEAMDQLPRVMAAIKSLLAYCVGQEIGQPAKLIAALNSAQMLFQTLDSLRSILSY